LIVKKDTASLDRLSLSDQLGDWNDEGTASIGHFAGKKIYGLSLNKVCKKYEHDHITKACKHCEHGEQGHGIHPVLKIASKGSRLTFAAIEAIMRGEKVAWHSEFPSFSVAGEPSFVVRNIRKTAKQTRSADFN
jgi:hypothetical protein